MGENYGFVRGGVGSVEGVLVLGLDMWFWAVYRFCFEVRCFWE